MEFRELDKKHLDKVSEIFVKAFNSPPWSEEWTKESAYARISQMINCDGSYGLVAFEDSKLVGMILGRKEQFYNGINFEVKEFCVDLSVGSKGIGTQLYIELEERLRAVGIKEIFLNTCRSNKTIGFYEKQGFKVSESIIVMNKTV